MTVLDKKLPSIKLLAWANNEMTTVNLEDYADKLVVLIFYPYDFTYVCPTEIIGFSNMKDQFEEVGAHLLFISCDSVYSHQAWALNKEGGIYGNTIPMLADTSGKLSKYFDIYLKKEGRSRRATFIVDNNTVVYELVHSDSIGRSSEETLRVISALKFSKENGSICPLNWKKQ
ncbi:peroxiredoxin 1 [Nematocida sp. AWRm80]|nr:peroxiredoxin 1 [Nematocida sp. AWRm80]